MLLVASKLVCLGIMELLGLEKPSKIMKPNHSLRIGEKQVPKCHIFVSFKSLHGWGL